MCFMFLSTVFSRPRTERIKWCFSTSDSVSCLNLQGRVAGMLLFPPDLPWHILLSVPSPGRGAEQHRAEGSLLHPAACSRLCSGPASCSPSHGAQGSVWAPRGAEQQPQSTAVSPSSGMRLVCCVNRNGGERVE